MTALQILTSHLGVGLLLAVFYISWQLKGLSYRMGEVTRMAPYYKGFTIGNILILIALLGYIFICSAALVPDLALLHTPRDLLLLFYIPLCIGLSINVTIAILYWGWLIREH